MDLIDHTHPPLAHTLRQYYELTKPRIVMLTAFCAVIGMFLAADGMVAWPVLVFGTIGISLLAGAGFTFNCMVERGIDARMARTRARPAARARCRCRPRSPSRACSAAWARRCCSRSSIR
jgi:protoheme IX farnesyltransferase